MTSCTEFSESEDRNFRMPPNAYIVNFPTSVGGGALGDYSSPNSEPDYRSTPSSSSCSGSDRIARIRAVMNDKSLDSEAKRYV
jgi:hypothetical protein